MKSKESIGKKIIYHAWSFMNCVGLFLSIEPRIALEYHQV